MACILHLRMINSIISNCVGKRGKDHPKFIKIAWVPRSWREMRLKKEKLKRAGRKKLRETTKFA